MSGNDPAGGARVDVSGFDLSTIWTLLKEERAEVGETQAALWQRIGDVCARHHDAVLAALDDLREKWPPTPGSAAQYFVDTIDGLLRSVSSTSDAAYSNARELRTLTDHVMDVRADIEGMVEERDKLSAGVHATPNASAADGYAGFDDHARKSLAASEPTVEGSALRIIIPTRYAAPKFEGSDTGGPDVGIGTPASWTPSGGSSGLGDPLMHTWGGTSGADDGRLRLVSGSVPELAGAIETRLPDGGAPSGQAAGGTPTSTAPGGPVIEGFATSALGRGPITGAHPGSQGPVLPSRHGGSDRSGGIRGATGSTGEAGVHGGLVGGAPMIAPTGGSGTTRGGVRVGRPGGLIGGGASGRRRPHDPDDPWAAKHEAVQPVIGGGDTPGGDEDEPPPGVIEVRGWPR